ncbi:MAG: hypothetical protein QOG52_471 [Frankiaceae bacterium]|nr:hypothetical protein [Frankiaceae bacterium]
MSYRFRLATLLLWLTSYSAASIFVLVAWLHLGDAFGPWPLFVLLAAWSERALRRPLPPDDEPRRAELRRVFDSGQPPADPALAPLVLAELEARERARAYQRKGGAPIGALVVAIGFPVGFIATALIRHDRPVTATAVIVLAVLTAMTLVQRRGASRRRERLEAWAAPFTQKVRLATDGLTASIVIDHERQGRWGGTYVIEVDGAPVGKCRSTLVVPVNAGRHSVQAWQSWASSRPLFVDVEADQACHVVVGPSRSLFAMFRPRQALTASSE